MSENFKIVEIKSNKKRSLQLLLIGDESETMIDRYLQKGNLYVGISNDISIAVCVTLIIDNTTVEIKNLAVRPDFHRCGFGRLMLKHVECENPDKSIILGTGETPSTLRFYEKCGFVATGEMWLSLFSPHTKFFHRQLFQSYYRRGGDTPRYGLFEKR